MLIVVDPDLVYEKCQEGAEGFEGTLDLFPQGYNQKTVLPQLSGQSRTKSILYIELYIIICAEFHLK